MPARRARALRRLRLPARGARGPAPPEGASASPSSWSGWPGSSAPSRWSRSPGTPTGLGWRSRVRVAVDGRGAVGFRRHRSHRLEYVDECPIASPAVIGDRCARRLGGRARPSSRSSTGTEPGEAVVSVTARAGRRPPRAARPRHRPRRAGEGPPAARRRACRGRAAAPTGSRPGSSGRSTSAPPRRCSTRSSTSSATAAGASVVDLYAGAGLFSVPLAEAVGPTGSVLAVERDGRACADARHNGADLPQPARPARAR